MAQRKLLKIGCLLLVGAGNLGACGGAVEGDDQTGDSEASDEYSTDGGISGTGGGFIGAAGGFVGQPPLGVPIYDGGGGGGFVGDFVGEMPNTGGTTLGQPPLGTGGAPGEVGFSSGGGMDVGVPPLGGAGNGLGGAGNN